MPRPRKQNALDAHVSALALQFGGALIQAIRDHLAAEVSVLFRNVSARHSATPPTAPPKLSGRLKRGSVSALVLQQLLGAIKTAPGLRSEEIYKKVRMSRKLAKAGLAKLREQNKVKLKGQKRSATYSLA